MGSDFIKTKEDRGRRKAIKKSEMGVFAKTGNHFGWAYIVRDFCRRAGTYVMESSRNYSRAVRGGFMIWYYNWRIKRLNAKLVYYKELLKK